MKAALKDVNESVKAFRPQTRQEVRTPPAHNSPAASAGEPKSMAEAIARSLNAA
jgi:hypothetical protein